MDDIKTRVHSLWLEFCRVFFSFVFVFELFCKVRNVSVSFSRCLSNSKDYRICLFSGEFCVFEIRFEISESLCYINFSSVDIRFQDLQRVFKAFKDVLQDVKFRLSDVIEVCQINGEFNYKIREFCEPPEICISFIYL